MGSTTIKVTPEPGLVWDIAGLQARLGSPALKVIDVRVGEDYAMGHIPGAVHFSVYGVNTYDTDQAPLTSFARMWAVLAGVGES